MTPGFDGGRREKPKRGNWHVTLGRASLASIRISHFMGFFASEATLWYVVELEFVNHHCPSLVEAVFPLLDAL